MEKKEKKRALKWAVVGPRRSFAFILPLIILILIISLFLFHEIMPNFCSSRL